MGLIDGSLPEVIYGVAFLDPGSNPWNVHFPPLTGSDEVLARTLMLCNLCQTLEVVHLNEIEVEVFEANRRIQRFCRSCLATTHWRQSAAEDQSVPAASGVNHVPDRLIKPSVEEKRKHSRIKSRASACVRQVGFPDDIVTCENLSRGGLLLRSSRRYAPDSQIQVAVPFSAGGANIFVAAYVVHVEELEGCFRIGVAYVRYSGKESGHQSYRGSATEIDRF